MNLSGTKMRAWVATASILWAVSALGAGGESSFSIVALPDTQQYSEPGGHGDIASFIRQTQWIADNADRLNIRFVTHLGDIVEHGEREGEWVRAARAIDRLDGSVPFGLLPGNHDFPEQKVHLGALNYLTHAGPGRLFAAGRDWFGGASPNALATYQVFEAGGRRFLHVSLEWGNANTSLPWAKRLLDMHAGLPTIVSTHANLRPDKTKRSHGQQLWDYLIHDRPQVFLVLSGHYSGQASKVSRNDAGQPVYEVVVDYQSWPNGGDGYFRLVTFDRDRRKILMRTISADGKPERTDHDSRFELDLPDFDDAKRFKPSPPQRTQTLGFDAAVYATLDESRSEEPGPPGSGVSVGAAPGAQRQGLLRFDALAERIPRGALIRSAVLRVATTDPGDGAQLYRMRVPWRHDATWNTFSSDGTAGVQVGSETHVLAPDVVGGFPFGFAVDWDAQAGPSTRKGQIVYADVTESVIAWAASPASNHGWLLAAPVGMTTLPDRPFAREHGGRPVGNDEWTFDAESARLRITYDVPKDTAE
jgi:hypothetical protein